MFFWSWTRSSGWCVRVDVFVCIVDMTTWLRKCPIDMVKSMLTNTTTMKLTITEVDKLGNYLKPLPSLVG